MSRMKYIMVDGNRPVIFLDTWFHDDMARMIGAKRITGAGFFTIVNGRAHCYGESASLGIKAHKDDSYWVNNALEIE